MTNSNNFLTQGILMNGSILFDQEGVWGPAATLLFNSPTTEDELKHVSKTLRNNYQKLSLRNSKTPHRGEFCAYILSRINKHKPITPEKVISTAFFQNMKCICVVDPSLHERVINTLVPAMLNQAHSLTSSAKSIDTNSTTINQWLAQFLESYLNSKQLDGHCSFHELLGSNEEIKNERMRIGLKLYQNVQNKNITEKNLDMILNGIESKSQDYLTDDAFTDPVKEFITMYNNLFCMAGEHSELFSTNVRNALTTTFRQKLFPQAVASSSSE